jgi:hypothetical protein
MTGTSPWARTQKGTAGPQKPCFYGLLRRRLDIGPQREAQAVSRTKSLVGGLFPGLVGSVSARSGVYKSL